MAGSWDSSCGPVVVGDTCATQINYGETVRLTFTYSDDSGQPTDISSAEFSVYSSSPAVIKENAVFTVLDGPGGVVEFVLHRDFATGLNVGSNNKFRIQAIFGEDSDDITPDIILVVT